MLDKVGFSFILVFCTLIYDAQGDTCSYLGMCERSQLCKDRRWCGNLIGSVPCMKTEECTEEWSEWNGCTRPCGGGMRTRAGVCRGAECTKRILDTGDCNTDPCPESVNGNWAEWSAWSSSAACSATCCGGTYSMTRSRTCSDPPPQGLGRACRGEAEEILTGVKCSMEGCPLSCDSQPLATVFPDPCGTCSNRFFACTGDDMPMELTCPRDFFWDEAEESCVSIDNCSND